MPSPLASGPAVLPMGQRNYPIDALRGLAILAVLVTHGAAPAGLPRSLFFFLPSSYRHLPEGNGYLGVVIFFAISGFLITTNMLKRHGHLAAVDLREFYLYRFARIAPPLLLLLAVTTVLFLAGWPDFRPANRTLFPQAIWSILTFRYNVFYFTGNVPGLLAFSPIWSLSIEELFYLFYPLACLLLRREGVIVAGLAGLVFVGPVVRNTFVDGFSWWGCADLLAIGCLTAILSARTGFHRRERKVVKAVLVVAGGALVAACFACDSVRNTFRFGPTLVALGTALILFATSRSRWGQWSLLTPFAFIGGLSYEIYLFHRAIVLLVVRAFQSDTHTSLTLALVVLAGFLVAHFYSEPLNRRIRGLYRRKPSPKLPSGEKSRTAATVPEGTSA